MQFDCGRTWTEKRANLAKWHRKFAWLPIRVAPHDCRWLEYVERRMTWHSVISGCFWDKEYRLCQ
jgi:hypothetical protein